MENDDTEQLEVLTAEEAERMKRKDEIGKLKLEIAVMLDSGRDYYDGKIRRYFELKSSIDE